LFLGHRRPKSQAARPIEDRFDSIGSTGAHRERP
jgi:hypothetical protein